MPIYEIRVTPAVARLRRGDSGTRNVQVVHTFSRHPSYHVGELPSEIANEPGLEVRQLPPEEAAITLRRGVLVNAHHCFSERLARSLAVVPETAPTPAARVAPSEDLVARVEALERGFAELLAAVPVEDLHAVLDRLGDMNRDELVALHEEVLGKKPHGNARVESIRDAIREALTAKAEDDDAED